MKQAITIEQYQELPEKSQLYFLEWMEKRGYKHLATIGQMLEFVDAHIPKPILFRRHTKNFTQHYWSVQAELKEYADELCDALWETVKDILKRD